METRPTLDPDYKVKATRPGWKAAVGFVAFFAFLTAFVSVVEA